MGSTVLITGATGHIGAAVVVKALEEGYTVRAAIRSLSKSDAISNIPAIKSKGLDSKLSFVEVPDILAPNAYDEAAKGADYAIHIASPLIHESLAKTDLNETIMKPAVEGTVNMLNAAHASGTVKRIVFTSSVVANLNPMDPTQESNAEIRRPVPPKLPEINTAYLGAKRAALLATDKFVEEKQPQFDVINVMPAYVVGRKELATNAGELFAGSNGFAFVAVTKGPIPIDIWAASCHIDDVTKVHVDSLKLPEKKNRCFGLSLNFDPNAIFDLVKERYPQAVEKGMVKQPSEPQKFHGLQYDCSETEKTFNIKFKPIEEQVDAVMRQAGELAAKAAKARG